MSHVIFRKQVSDGNYGSETAEVLLDLPDDEVDSDLINTYWTKEGKRHCRPCAARRMRDRPRSRANSAAAGTT